MKNLYLHQHLGLGDQIICNGLTRYLCKQYDTVFLFVYAHNMPSIKFMYRDLGNKMKFISVPKSENWIDHIRFIDSFKNIFRMDDHIRIGYDYLDKSSLCFDKAFYAQLQIPFQERFDGFYIERDKNKELIFFNNFNVKENEYIFIHEGGSENSSIDYNKIKSPLKQVMVNISLTSNIFDYYYLIEHAAEIHCVESSFLFMIDSMHTNGELISHRYARKLTEKTIPTLQKKWRIIL